MRLLIVYGSQTGTAQDIAESIWRTSKQYKCNGPVLSLDDYNIENLITEKLVVFIVSTTGQGAEPENMKKFWKFLCRKSLPIRSLENMKFAVLGLGDSSYVQFNFVAKRLHKRLLQLSATPLLPLGLCDDQHDHGLYATYFPWKKNLWNALQIYTDPESIKKQVFKMIVTEKSEMFDLNEMKLDNLKWPFDSNYEKFTLLQNYRATAKDHFQDVRNIKLKFPKNVYWNPFDIIDLRPWNSDKIVNQFFKILSDNNVPITKNTQVDCKSFDEEMELPLCFRQSVSIEFIAKYVWDLTATARQKIFELLAINCEDDIEKEKLLELCTAEGLEDFMKYATRPKRNILEVLNDFVCATSKLTLPILFEMFDIIKVRSFSIASCPEEGSLRLLVAVVDFKTILIEPRKGLCSNWLKYLRPNEEILGSVKKGTMKVPYDNTPLVFIGPGTGIAPFRSFLVKIEHDIKSAKQTKRKIIVFFGCRNQDKDFFFKNDFARLQKRSIAKFYYAFSRDQENKIYVQHLIKKTEENLRNLVLFNKGSIFVAGSSNNMPKQVRETFNEIFGNPNYLEEILIKGGRYQEESWS